MDRVYQANAIETPPSTTASSGSYPTAGNKASGQLATVPGPYWFYSITEEIRNALIKAGITPDASKVNQLAEALGKYLPLSGGTLTGDLRFSGGVINRTDDLSGLTILGGTGTNGAFIQMFGNGATGNEGCFNFVATNGVATGILRGQPDGTLLWNNANVEQYLGIGSNYIRYTSGLQICWGDSATGSDSVAYGSFPVPFSQIPHITGNVIGDTPNDFSVLIRSRDGMGFTATTNFDNAYRPSVAFCWIAIGRWR